MHSFSEVKKKDSISYEEFISEHLNKGIPVVFKNASAAWPSNKMFTPEFFSENFGSYTTKSGDVEYTMNEVLELTAKSTSENPAPYPILFEIPEQLPELLKLLEPMHMNYAKPNWFNSKTFPYGKFGKNVHLFIGGKGNQYALHKDWYHTNAWITQLHGVKKFVVFPRDQEEYLYPGKGSFESFSSPINILNPDYDKYPNYKKATPIEIDLEPGETIFIPNGIWHTTVAPGHNISLIFDQLNATNFDAWKKDVYEMKKTDGKLKALLHYAYAVSAGSACKTAELTGAKF